MKNEGWDAKIDFSSPLFASDTQKDLDRSHLRNALEKEKLLEYPQE